MTQNISIDDIEIQEIEQEGVYKYLGIEESDKIEHTKMKAKIEKEYKRRLKMILKSELNSRNKIEAINTLAIPTITYSFGIIDWCQHEINKIDIFNANTNDLRTTAKKIKDVMEKLHT